MVKYDSREQLIKLVSNFFDRAFEANSYFDIAKQFEKNNRERHDDMKMSPAFYSYTRNAIIVASIMEISKLYDRSSQAINIKKLLDICYENKHLFITQDKHYQHSVSPDEKDFFKEEYDNLNELETLNLNSGNLLRVEMTIDRYFELYRWQYDQLTPKITFLLRQRNKIYAHSDEDKIFKTDEFLMKYPIQYKDAETLLSYAFKVIHFATVMLTDTNKPPIPINIKDWENTLDLVRNGKEFLKEKFEEEFSEGSFSD